MTDRGFTLIEVMIALVLLTAVMLGTAQLTATMVHTAATSGQQTAAVELAESRLAQIRVDPNYAGLESLYVVTETTFPTLSGFRRQTQILHVSSLAPPSDYKKITVTVNGPGLLVPVTRTVSVAAP